MEEELWLIFGFVMRSGPTVGKVYPLEAAEISIGRDSSNMVAINDAEVSRRHARMELRGSAYMIQDLGSTNGTFVNGTRITGLQVLNPGDTVAFGEGSCCYLMLPRMRTQRCSPPKLRQQLFNDQPPHPPLCPLRLQYPHR